MLEQNYCAWSCQTCIQTKVVNSYVPKVPNDNNNSTNQPIPPNAPTHEAPVKEKERKKRKNSKTNGKSKSESFKNSMSVFNPHAVGRDSLSMLANFNFRSLALIFISSFDHKHKASL